ncbi:MAG: PhzF family phenazine biosynthesis protein [Steroidobacteraceae bacterium]
MRLAFHLLNVFIRDAGSLTGNPLAVFEHHPGLDAARMQALARQFNLSESTFLAPSARATAAVRIFTPTHEMGFAGHPTLGTAHVVRLLQGGDAITLEMPAGVIPVGAQGDTWTLTANAPTHREAGADRAAIAAALGLEAGAVIEHPLWVDAGTEQLIVPVRTAADVAQARPAVARLGALRGAQGLIDVLVFAPAAGEAIAARFFFGNDDELREDPATGSACANLGGWFLAQGAPPPLARRVLQGDAIGRPSTLLLSIDAQQRIRVGGAVRRIGGGTLEI